MLLKHEKLACPKVAIYKARTWVNAVMQQNKPITYHASMPYPCASSSLTCSADSLVSC